MKRLLSLLLCSLIVLTGIPPALVCFADEPDFVAADGDVTVKVTAEDAFPENTEMKATTVEAGDDFISVDISFVCNGAEVEPVKEVSVFMSYGQLDGEEFEVSHNGKVIDTATSTNAEFETSSFSIYTISEVKIDTYNFYDGDTLLSSQRVKTGETVYAPAMTSRENEIFEGWKSDEKDYGDFDTYTADEASNKIINLYPYYSESLVHVYYTDGNRVLYTVTGHKGETVSLDANPAVPLSHTETFVGWYLDEACTTPAPDELVLESDTTLYPKRADGHWVYFDTDGGNYIDPVFLAEDEVTTEPEAPVKAGYTFSGWERDGQPYAFNETITEDLTLKAVYEPAETTYTIIIWQQSVNDRVDDEPTYDYYSATQETGVTGENIVVDDSYTGYDFTGFHYSRTDGDATINGDGSSVVNVYYNRDVITLRFYNSTRYSGTYVELKGLYGTTLEQNGYTQPEPAQGFMWRYIDYGDSTVFVSQVTRFGYTTDQSRTTGISRYCLVPAGHYRYYYYLENRYDLNDPDYSSADLTNFTDSGAMLTVSQRRIKGVLIGNKFQGFSPYWVKYMDYSGNRHSREIHEHEMVWNVLLNTDYPLIIYFKRNVYHIDFVNGTETTSRDVLYDDSLSGIEYTPECPYATGEWVFDGWYEDDTYYKKFDFNTKMPFHNLVLYARWVPAQYTIRIHGTDGSLFDKTEVDYGEKITHDLFPTVICDGATVDNGNEKPYELPSGSEWYGWVNENGVAVNFGQTVTHDMDYYPFYIDESQYVIIYHSGDNTAYSDKVYSSGATARIGQNRFDEMNFTGWNTKEDGTGDTWLPDDSYTFGEADLELYAQYRTVRQNKTRLVYHSDDDTYTEDYTVNDQVTIKPCMFTKAGYRFRGWVDENNNWVDGTVIIDGDRNDLYAVWEKIPETPAGKTDQPSVVQTSVTTSQSPRTGDTVDWYLALLLAGLIGSAAGVFALKKSKAVKS